MGFYEAAQFGMNDLTRSIFIDFDCDEVTAPDVSRGFMDGGIVAREKRERRIKCFLKHIHPSRENLFLRSIKLNYLKYGALTDKQIDAFKKTVERMKESETKATVRQ